LSVPGHSSMKDDGENSTVSAGQLTTLMKGTDDKFHDSRSFQYEGPGSDSGDLVVPWMSFPEGVGDIDVPETLSKPTTKRSVEKRLII